MWNIALSGVYRPLAGQLHCVFDDGNEEREKRERGLFMEFVDNKKIIITATLMFTLKVKSYS